MARKSASAPQLPLDERTPEQKELAEGYAALLKILYSKPWDGMTPESLLADADTFEADFDVLPEARKTAYAAALADARVFLGRARAAAERGDVPTAWEWMCSVARTREFVRRGM